uniref:Putative capsid protein n=1 Tax=viral metagenome TaxID=1070528 RepID=A0A6M3J2S9_9ZZZZ
MAITTTSIIADTIPTILEEARFTEQFKAIMPPLCWNIKKELHDGKNVNLPFWGTATATTLVEGQDMSASETMADTLVTLTPAEYGCRIVYSHKVARDNKEDVSRAAGRILGDAMVTKRDTDCTAQLDDGTNSLGGSGTLTMGVIAAARAILAGNAVSTGGPAPMPYAVVHHPYTLLDLVDVVTPIVPTATYLNVTGTAFTDDILKNYTIGKLFGMMIYEDGNIAIASNVAKGGVFATGKGGALVLATALEWELNPQDDFSLRATELNCVGEYAVGEYLAGWIVELANDATTPA